MTDISKDTSVDATADSAPSKSGGAGKIWRELGPVLLFVVVYNLVRRMPEGGGLFAKETAIYWGTGVFMAAIFAVIGWTVYKKEPISPMLIVTGVIVTVFGGLTIYLQSPEFAYYKPTIINLLFAGLIFGGLAFGKNVWKIAFQHAFDLPDYAWKVFAIRWGLFYIALAALNEFLWRTQTEDFWANSKIFLVMPATFLFMMANMPYLMKHSNDDAFGSKAENK
ncbi:inner membrane-spanning protein YciB [Hirschia litorea]|uniref:Inner membrane-spanning protein YciB n=1 Tax=Hirschia litorea TaxID=1199156 RepID=A0ABW2IM19_9PROT